MYETHRYYNKFASYTLWCVMNYYHRFRIKIYMLYFLYPNGLKRVIN